MLSTQYSIGAYQTFNPYLINGFSHIYQMDESTFIFRGVRSDFYFFISFFDVISLCKKNSPDGTPRSVAMLFAYVPQKGRQT